MNELEQTNPAALVDSPIHVFDEMQGDPKQMRLEL